MLILLTFNLAGELAIFADVLDKFENFPYFPTPNMVANVADLFGVVGIEIDIGSAQNGRTQPTSGMLNKTLRRRYTNKFNRGHKSIFNSYVCWGK